MPHSLLRHLPTAIGALLVPLFSAGLAHAQTSPVHTVADGESLSQIAAASGASLASLESLNHLGDGDPILVGQQLQLPSNSQSAGPSVAPAASGAATYTVAPGDTLGSISQTLNISPQALAAANSAVSPDQLTVGTPLQVPSGAATTQTNAIPTQAASNQGAQSTSTGRTHVIQSGETLRSIAAAENVDVGALIDFNNLADPYIVEVGQALKIPGGQPANTSQTGATTGSQSAPTASSGQPGLQIASVAGSAAALPTPPTAAAGSPGAATTPNQPAPTSATNASTSATTSGAAAHPTQATVVPPSNIPAGSLTATALKFLGAPYVWSGASPSGFDCSGFVWYVAHLLGKAVPRTLDGEYQSGAHPTRDQLQPGDLVFFQNTYAPGLSHDGIYVGNGTFIHAADERTGVTLSSLLDDYWSSHWYGATRL